jgi:2,5-diamino-6-(ribosylamino)-4(3H)-pyrimidinone 5'-phosphate reductase
MTKPVVTVLNSASLDGKIAVSPDRLLLYGDERWQAVEGSSDFDVFEWLKTTYRPQATLEGSGSFVREDDEPAPLPLFEGDAGQLYQDFLPEAVVYRAGHVGWFTVVDSRGRVRWAYTHEFPDEAWQGWRLLVLACRQTPAEYLAYLQREEVPYIIAGTKRVDLGLALEKMNARLGVDHVLSTAGGKLNGALLRGGLVDEINIEILPVVIGGYETPSLFASPVLKSDEWPVQLNLTSAQVQAGGRVWLRYRVARLRSS